MKALIYKVLSKGLLILLLLCLVALYHYRGELFPNGYGVAMTAPTESKVPPLPKPAKAPVPAATPVVNEPPVEPASVAPVANEGGASAKPATVTQTPAFAPMPDADAVVTDQPAEGHEPASVEQDIILVQPAMSLIDTVTGTAQENVQNDTSTHGGEQTTAVESGIGAAPVSSNVFAPVTEMGPAPSHATRFVPVEVTNPPSDMQTQEEIPSPLEALLAQARDAYWVGDYELAKTVYEQALAIGKDDPAPYGELGNVYFAQGDWDAAADAYLQAAQRLLAQDRVSEAKHLVLVLQGLNSKHADRLREAIPPQDQ